MILTRCVSESWEDCVARIWLRVAFLDLDLDEVKVLVLNSRNTRYSLLGVDVVGGWFTW